MKALFLVLVLANLAVFAWSRYFSAAPAAAEGVLARRDDAGDLKIVPPADVASACLEWGSFSPADYARAEKALEPLALGTRLAQRRTDDAAGWWVFIPPQGSRQAALKKAAELKALGVHDYYIMGEEGDSPWALSLGVFRTEQAALARLAMLREQGVRSALVGSRDTVAPKLWLQVKGVDAALEARLREIARQLEGSELRNCR
jgi:hypothetical protein